jgi:hypothetical protein
MKIIVAGGRDITDKNIVYKAIEIGRKFFEEEITWIVSGCCRGVDRFGEWWAKINNIPIEYFPADWDRLGRAAGPIRNKNMARFSDGLIAVWDGKSRGTGGMIKLAQEANIPVFIYYPDGKFDFLDKVRKELK